MSQRKIRTRSFILLMVTLLVFSPSLAAARPPHHDYDQAELDLSAVYSSLNMTKEDMVISLDHSLRVNYSQRYEERVEGYEYGLINVTFNNESFDRIEETEEQIDSDLRHVREMIKEMEDDVPSYVYLRRYYIPFYDLSRNLTTFSENHHDFVLNMEKGVGIFNNISEEEETELHYPDMMERVDDASFALETMSDSLDLMEGNIENIRERTEEEQFNFTEMKVRIDELRKMIEQYRDHLDMLIREQTRLPAFLTARAPVTVHPGERFEVTGVYVEGHLFELDAEKYDVEEGPIDETLREAFEEREHPIPEEAYIQEEDLDRWWITDDDTKMYLIEERITGELEISLTKESCKEENVTIFLDGKRIAQNESREGNYYSSEVKIPWNIFSEKGPWEVEPGDVMELKAVSEKQNISSVKRNITVEKWPAEIELSLEKEKKEYFDENVSISGEFICRAPVDFDMVNLSARPTTQIDKDNDDYTFHLDYHTRRFDWGENTVDVFYQENETIDNASKELTFEKNIPTELTIESNKGESDIEYLRIKGRLLNASSKVEEGFENKEVILKVNEEKREKIETSSDGTYNFTISIDPLEDGDIIYTVFEGDRKYRGSRSEGLEITSEDIDAEDLIESDLFSLILAIIIGTGLIGSFLLRKRGKESSGDKKDRDHPGSEMPESERRSITGGITPSLKATSREEISRVYGRLLSSLSSKGLISVKKGTTHRELERELLLKTDLEDEIRDLTSIFEKALFTDRPIGSSEIQKFNSSLKEVEGELL